MKYIKRLKIYENNNKPNIGDYIITNSKTHSISSDIQKLYAFLNNNIGKVVDYDNNELLVVEYENVPENIEGFFRTNYKNRRIPQNNIEYHSNNKEDCETYLASKQYNL